VAADLGEAAFVPFEEWPHTADLALRARGRDLAELILNVCRGVIALIGEAEGMAPEERVEVDVEAPDPERLLVRTAKQLLYEWERAGGMPVAAEIRDAPPPGWLDNPTMPGRLRVRFGFAHPADLGDRISAIPKAATYHDLHIERAGELLEVTLVLDV
jgi:SHS2 domain-containing protein